VTSRKKTYGDRFNVRVCRGIGVMLVSLLLFSCVPDFEKPWSPADNVVFAVTSNFSDSASFSTVDISSLTPYADVGAGMIHTDAYCRYAAPWLYVINALGRNNIQIIDPAADYTTLREITMKEDVDNNSNPHDIAVISSTEAWVTRYNDSELYKVNPTTGLKTGEIDLALYAYSGSGGVPCMDKMYYDTSSSELWVALQRLDTSSSYATTAYSSVLVIDPGTEAVNEIQLTVGVTAKNPAGHFRFVSKDDWQPTPADNHDHLFISCIGENGFNYAEDGGIIALDLFDEQMEDGFVITETDFSGEAMDFVIKNATTGYAVLSKADFTTCLVRFDPSDGTVTSVIREQSNAYGNLWRLELHSSGYLYLCDRAVTSPGIRVYDTDNSDLPLNNNLPVYVGLPPADMAFIE